MLREEVEEVFFNAPHVRRTHGGRYLAYGITDEGRYVLVVFVQKPGGNIGPITAREMDQDELRLYLRNR